MNLFIILFCKFCSTIKVFANFIDFKFVLWTDMYNGCIGDMVQLGITESLRVKRQMLVSASEAAEMILRVDNIIRASPRQRARDNRPC